MPERKPRRRRRAIGGIGEPAPPTKKQPSDGLKNSLEYFLTTRREANEAASRHRGTKETLMSMMADEDIATLKSDEHGQMVAVHTPERNVVDLEVLRKHVDDETFMRIVSASQSAVSEHAGKTLLNSCLRPEPGNQTLKVSKA